MQEIKHTAKPRSSFMIIQRLFFTDEIILETKNFEISIPLPNTNSGRGHNRWPLLWLVVDGPCFSNNFVRLLYVTPFLSVKTKNNQIARQQ